ncbi:MAG: hypothetical protein LQ338_005807 [Usnochroma carphineum]|nr:MAG: hypothetical protein LQ338_005807 [Usnochroma carphineum]
MEPPLKRRRLSASGNPDMELHERRSRNHRKLKSRFESIFEKYGKDFSNVGDEIDMHTGKIVVSNGHIMNMTDETDPGNKDEWLDEEDVLSHTDTDERQHSAVIPDSQGLDSSDDDPLGMLEDLVHSKVSNFRQRVANSSSKNRESHSSPGQPRMKRLDHASCRSARPYKSSPSRGSKASSRLRDNSFAEEAWRAPPLPEDSDVRLGLPSPSPSEQEGFDSSRPASPLGVSIWAPEAQGRRSRGVNRTSVAWTKDEDQLLTYYRTFTELTFKAIRDQFPGRTGNSLQQRWCLLKQDVQLVSQYRKRNTWTPEEDKLLQKLKTTPGCTVADIQSGLPRHSHCAIDSHWQVMRRKLGEESKRAKYPPSDPPSPTIANSAPPEYVVPARDALDQLIPPHSSHLLGPAHYPGNAGANIAAQPIVTLGKIESDQSGSRWSQPVVEPRCPHNIGVDTVDNIESAGETGSDRSKPQSDDVGARQGKYPSGTVVADSQGEEETQHFLNHSVDPQACLQKSVPLQKFQVDDSTAELDLLPVLATVAADKATESKTHSTHRVRPQGSIIPQSRKRKRVLDQGNDYRPILPKTGHEQPATSIPGSPQPVPQPLSQPGQCYRPNGRRGPSTITLQNWEALRLCEQDLLIDQLRDPSRRSCHGDIPDFPLYTDQRDPLPTSSRIPGVPLCRQMRNSVLRPQDWERIRADVQSAPCSDGTPHPVASESLAVPSSQAESLSVQPRPANDLAAGSNMVAERPMAEIPRMPELLPAGKSDSGRRGSIADSGRTVTPTHRNHLPEKLDEAPAELSSAVEATEWDILLQGTEQYHAIAERNIAEAGAQGSLSAEASTLANTHLTADEPAIELSEKPAEAATSACVRLLRVEIPRPSFARPFSHRAAAPDQEHDIGNHGRVSALGYHTATKNNHQTPSKIQGFEQSNISDMQPDNERCSNRQGSPQSFIAPIRNDTLTEKRAVIDDSHSTRSGFSPDGSSTNQEAVPVNLNDEDDLQLPLEPALACSVRRSGHRKNNNSARHVALGSMFDEMDMSDDELSTPSKVTGDRVGMTSVRSLKDSRRKLTSLF